MPVVIIEDFIACQKIPVKWTPIIVMLSSQLMRVRRAGQ